jgi:hypothetical protein
MIATAVTKDPCDGEIFLKLETVDNVTDSQGDNNMKVSVVTKISYRFIHGRRENFVPFNLSIEVE